MWKGGVEDVAHGVLLERANGVGAGRRGVSSILYVRRAQVVAHPLSDFAVATGAARIPRDPICRCIKIRRDATARSRPGAVDLLPFAPDASMVNRRSRAHRVKLCSLIRRRDVPRAFIKCQPKQFETPI